MSFPCAIADGIEIHYLGVHENIVSFYLIYINHRTILISFLLWLIFNWVLVFYGQNLMLSSATYHNSFISRNSQIKRAQMCDVTLYTYKYFAVLLFSVKNPWIQCMLHYTQSTTTSYTCHFKKSLNVILATCSSFSCFLIDCSYFYLSNSYFSV
jgi:hypothetical protein